MKNLYKRLTDRLEPRQTDLRSLALEGIDLLKSSYSRFRTHLESNTPSKAEIDEPFDWGPYAALLTIPPQAWKNLAGKLDEMHAEGHPYYKTPQPMFFFD